MAVKKKTPKQKKTKITSKTKLLDSSTGVLNAKDAPSYDNSDVVERLLKDNTTNQEGLTGVDKLLEAVKAAGLLEETHHKHIKENITKEEEEGQTTFKLVTLQTLTSHTNQIQVASNDIVHQTELVGTNSKVDVVVDTNSNTDYVVEYIVPDSTSEHRTSKKRKFLESLKEVEECNTKLKKIKVENEELDLDCEWEECSHNNKSWAKFMEHVRLHIGDTQIRTKEQSEEPDMFLCLWEECGFECGSSGEMVRHINYHSYHTKLKCLGLNLIKLQGLRGCSLDTNQSNIFQDFTEPFKCKWFSCSEFFGEFEHPQLFYWHVARHADDATKFDCKWDDCHKKDFASKTRLREHLRSHSQEKQFACPTCGACFATKIKLFDHLKRQQESAANFICSNCNKAFVLERLLRDHMRSHINTYDCEECGMCWPTPSALKTHIMYRHSDERCFPCDSCDYRAKSHHDLKQHARSHQGEVLSCMEGCGFVCKSNSVMKHHILKVHLNNSGKYACHLCESVYKRGALLTGHLKKKHNIVSNTSRFRYSLDEATGMYRVQLYRYELQDEDKEANLEIDTEVESLYQASPAPSSSTYMDSPTPSSVNHLSPTQSSSQYQPSPASTNYQPSPVPSSSAHYPSPAPHSNGQPQGGMPIVAVRSKTSTDHNRMPDSDWSQEGSSVRSSILSSVRSQEGSSILSSVRSSLGASVHSQVSVEGLSMQSYQDLGYSYPFADKVQESLDEEQNIWISTKFRSSTPDVEIDVTRDEFN